MVAAAPKEKGEGEDGDPGEPVPTDGTGLLGTEAGEPGPAAFAAREPGGLGAADRQGTLNDLMCLIKWSANSARFKRSSAEGWKSAQPRVRVPTPRSVGRLRVFHFSESFSKVSASS